LLILVTGCAAFFSSCIREHITDVTLNKITLELLPGESEILIATVYPNDATNKKVTWESSNSEVVTVNDNGLVAAIEKGEATITVTTVDENKTANCVIKVSDYRDKWIGDYIGIKKTNSFIYEVIVDVTVSGASNLKIIQRGASAYNPDAYHDVKANEDGSFNIGSNIEGVAFPLFGKFYPDSLYMTTKISMEFIDFFLKKNKKL
jgi:hypothetical protein